MLNKMLISNAPQEDIQAVSNEVKKLLPSLKVIGVFDLFNIEEWLNTNNQPGRILVVTLYLQQYPSLLTGDIKNSLRNIVAVTKFNILKNEIDKIKI